MDKIIKNNRLIAEFMGAEITAGHGFDFFHYDKCEVNPLANSSVVGSTYCGDGEAKYHESLDWLMPVCKKIWSMDTPRGIIDIEVLSGDISKTHRAVIGFIIWYNERN